MMGFLLGNTVGVKHGLSRTKVYRAYQSMKNRCYRISNENYKDYGGRGILVCDRWLESFSNFYKDMGEPPSPKHSLDRIDSEKGYCKTNCKWSTITEQNNNKRLSKDINKTGYRGVTKSRSGYQAMVKRVYIGHFKTKEEAALAYNQKAIELYGDKAILNEV